MLYLIPNVPHPSVPEGKSDEDNVEIFSAGNMPKLHDKAQPHGNLLKNTILLILNWVLKSLEQDFQFILVKELEFNVP